MRKRVAIMLGVPSVEEFRSVTEILLQLVPAETDIASVALAYPDSHWMVRVRTRTPGLVIGRRGATADQIRAAMADSLGDGRLQLNIEEEGPGPS